MSSRYQIIECQYKQVEYRKAGMLYYTHMGNVWFAATGVCAVRDQQVLMDSGYTYAILVEEDDSLTTEDDACD